MGIWFLWQRMRDSNPRKRSQSPVCYRYTNPLCAEHLYYNQLYRKVKKNFEEFEKSLGSETGSTRMMNREP